MTTELTLENNSPALKSAKDYLINQPVSRWCKIINELMNDCPKMIGHHKSFEEILELLIKEFGPIDR